MNTEYDILHPVHYDTVFLKQIEKGSTLRQTRSQDKSVDTCSDHLFD